MQLNYKVFGQGDPIIVLHGLFGTLDNWQTIGKQLAENYTVFLVDLRNHGKSPKVEGMSYPLMAKDVAAFLEAQWIHEVHLIGHSMGGKVAMQLALDFPDVVSKLVVIDIAPKAYKGGHEQIFNALLQLPVETLKSRTEADQLLQQNGIDEFGIRQFLLKNLSRQKTGGYIWKMNLLEIHKHYNAILANIESEEVFGEETLFIKGANSKYIQDKDLPSIAALFPTAKVVSIENAGHWVHADQPKLLLEAIQAFLAL